MIKKILLIVFLLASQLSFAQTVENANFRMEYVTFTRGYIVISFSNLTPACRGNNNDTTQPNLQVRCRWGTGGKDTTLFFYTNEIRQVMLPSAGGDVNVEAKTVTSCNKGFNGPWLSLSLTALYIRNEPGYGPPPKPAPVKTVRIIGIYSNFLKEMPENEFLKQRNFYRRYYFIIRPDRPKEIIL